MVTGGYGSQIDGGEYQGQGLNGSCKTGMNVVRIKVDILGGFRLSIYFCIYRF